MPNKQKIPQRMHKSLWSCFRQGIRLNPNMQRHCTDHQQPKAAYYYAHFQILIFLLLYYKGFVWVTVENIPINFILHTVPHFITLVLSETSHFSSCLCKSSLKFHFFMIGCSSLAILGLCHDVTWEMMSCEKESVDFDWAVAINRAKKKLLQPLCCRFPGVLGIIVLLHDIIPAKL